MKRGWVWGCLVGACASVPGPPPQVDQRPRAALLEAADQAVALGPVGADLEASAGAARTAFQRDHQDQEAAWRWARALYFQSLGADDDRAAERSATCLRELSALERSKRAEGQYYWALCLGARAQARPLEGQALVKRMLAAAERAIALDPKVEQAGPRRLLGGILLRAPGWPASVGDLDRAILVLAEAAEAAPEWPENHLLYAEALLADGQRAEAARALDRAEATLERLPQPGWRPIFSAQWAALRARLLALD